MEIMAEPVLTMIILACTLNVSDPTTYEKPVEALTTDTFFQDSSTCRTYTHIIDAQVRAFMTPYECMMKSAIHIPEFMQEHPGMMPRKWSCRMLRPIKET